MARGVGCRGCLIGCAAVVAVLVLVPLVLWAVSAGIGDRPPLPISDVQEHPLPVSAPEPSGDQPTDGGLAGELPEFRMQGLVRLDVSAAELDVVPGLAGEPLRLEADYDAAAFLLEESLEETGDGWEYSLRHAPRFATLARGGGRDSSRLRLILPPGHPLTLAGRVRWGESRIELGGLSLVEVDLRLGAGEHEVSFGEPLPRPLRHLSLDASFGELSVHRVGNASPLTTRIEHSAGELRVDLEGAWRQDGEVRVSFGFGTCRIALPATIPAIVERASLPLGERRISGDEAAGEGGGPRVHLWASGTAGELWVN